jgi:hypothetical protein
VLARKVGAGDGNRTHDIQLGKPKQAFDTAQPRSPSATDERNVSWTNKS